MDFSDERERIAFFRIKEDDREALKGLLSRLGEFPDSVIDAFYRHILSFPETRKIVEGVSLDFLRKRHKEYFKKILNLDLKEGFLERAVQVGHRHLMVGVLPKYYMGSFSVIFEELMRCAGDVLEAHEIPQASVSLFKALILDMSSSIEAYFREKEEKIEAINRLYSVLSSVNSLIVRMEEKDELLREVCRTIVEDGGYIGACVYMVEGKTLTFRASWGDCSGAEKVLERALSEDRVVLEKGLIAVPIRSYLGAVGVLVVSVGGEFEPSFKELKLFSEIGNDISYALESFERKRKLEYLSFYDPLTGLPNRAQFLSKLDRLIDSARHKGSSIGVLALDVDRFKHVNDAFDFTFGDAVLRAIGDRLSGVVRGGDEVGRLGSDEFGIALMDVGGEKGVLRVIAKIKEAFRKPIVIDGNPVYVTFSMGVSLFPRDGNKGEILLKNAEVALSKAKEEGGDTFSFFSPKANRDIEDFIRMEVKLRKALERNEFVLFFQPKVDLKNMKVSGAEALIRWIDPEEGLVPPGRFIPVLESLGLIVDVGEWVIRDALSKVSKWLRKGLEVKVAVNVSALQFRDDRFPSVVESALRDTGVPPELFEVEITESLIVQNINRAVEILGFLRNMGISVTVDDFGTGYSSLSYLKNLPVDALKIDISFVRGIPESQDDVKITKAIVGLAKALSLRTVAEGVERESQLDALKNMECDEVQGFLFSPPRPPEEFESFLVKFGR